MRKVLLSTIVAIIGLASVVAFTWPRSLALVSPLPPSAAHQDAASGPVAVAAAPGPTSFPWQLQRPAARKPFPPRILMPYLVLVVLDGARSDYFSVPGIPHVRALIKNGTSYTNAWTGILESETPSGHASIGTGSEPRQDGIPSFSWATSDNVSVNLFDPDVIRRGAMESILTQAHVPTIAGLVHKKDRSAKVVALSGHKYYAADAIGGPNADVIMYYSGTPSGTFAPTSIPGHVPPAGILSAAGLTKKTTRLPVGLEDHLAMSLAITTFKKMHQRVTLINVPEFDWPLGHVNGGDRDPALVRSLMQGFDRDLGRLEDAYRKAGVLDRTEFVLTADHGMAPIYYTVSKDRISKAVAAARTTVISESYHTAAYLWVNNESRAKAAARNIVKLRNPYIQSVYFKVRRSKGFTYARATRSSLFKTPAMDAANQFLLGTFGGSKGPDIVVLFAENAGSEPDGQAHWTGDHGGSAWESQHIPLVFSGPGIRRGYISTYPARLMDIAPTALSLMGVPDTGMTGVPLADAMVSPASWMQAAQRQQSNALWPVISALQTESRLDTKAKR